MPRLPTCKADGCSNKFERAEPFQCWCSIDCAISIARKRQNIANKKKIAAQKKREKIARAQNRARKQMTKTLSTLCAEAQRAVNKLRRLEDERDYGRCISCNGAIDDAGHYHAVGSKYRTSRLRFLRENINGQCAHCNRFVGGGNKEAYARGYEARYGREALHALNELRNIADSGGLEPLSKSEVLKIKKDALEKIKKLKLC